ncbi:putative hydrolase of the HAD superfamily [Syntrophus gentianae]|uniref:Putative hydrolase of the HAD superfamily n=1 Tax=Syntrophus gentianae TaxID=43775 RepID=A0A1H7VRD3_9BACT|nr:HAD family hydrolase [Syntrophus gentianae]SEM11357.1 putative hydrolase of the HAD superfamily [Syntrophus gentianae]
MALEVKWVGFDFGQCMMNPTGLRNHLVIADVSKELGQPELIEERIQKYRIMKEKYGTYSAVKEGHRDEIMEYVFDGDEEAKELFSAKEQEHLSMGPGLPEALAYLQDTGIHIAVVAELKKTLGAMNKDIVTRFLEKKGLTHYFEELVSPQGRVDFKDGSINLAYKGKTKEAGTIYDELCGDLAKRGIKPEECAMVGDKLGTDIIPAKKRGINTVQYTGYIDMGVVEEADYRIESFLELKDLLRKKV